MSFKVHRFKFYFGCAVHTRQLSLQFQEKKSCKTVKLHVTNNKHRQTQAQLYISSTLPFTFGNNWVILHSCEISMDYTINSMCFFFSAQCLKMCLIYSIMSTILLIMWQSHFNSLRINFLIGEQKSSDQTAG